MTDHASTIANAVARLNTGDVDGYVRALYHPHCRFHGFPDAFGSDRDGIANFFRAFVGAVPDARITADDLFADGDHVAVRYTLTGTHEGELFGAAATGRPLDVEGITLLRFENDLVAERWNRLDDVTLLTQLGLLPVAAPT
jgi:predicted ester cyclase